MSRLPVPDWFSCRLVETAMAAPEATSVNVDARRVNTAISAVIAGTDSVTTIEEEQENALAEFLSGGDVFAVLPTTLIG